jgi:hypothetical protein
MFDGPPRYQPVTPQPQDWENLGRDEEPIRVNGEVRTLDTSDDVANREENREGLARSLEQHAKLPLKEANRLVRALFCQAHPTEEKRRTLDPGMLRVATSLFNDPDCAQHLSSFTKLGVDAQKRELLKMAAELERETNPSPKAQRMFSLSMLAHVRTLPPETILGGTALCHPDTGKPDDAMRNAWRLAVRSADSTSSGPLLREFRAFSDEIYGPLDSSRDFKALAEDMAVVRFPERFIRQTDLHTANISAQIVRNPRIADYIEILSCYAAYRDTRIMTPSILDDLEKKGEFDLKNGKPLPFRDEASAKKLTEFLLGMVNDIACKEYGIPLVPLKFDGVTDPTTAAEYNLQSRDIYVNLDHALKRGNENVGIAAVIGSLVHECTHAWHHQLTINPDVPKPPGWRDAEAILDFNFKNYASPAMVHPTMYERQPTERHAHAAGFAVQRNIEHSLGSKVNNLSNTPMSDTRRLLVAGWAQSATNPYPREFEGDEHKAMGMASLFPDTRPRPPSLQERLERVMVTMPKIELPESSDDEL